MRRRAFETRLSSSLFQVLSVPSRSLLAPHDELYTQAGYKPASRSLYKAGVPQTRGSRLVVAAVLSGVPKDAAGVIISMLYPGRERWFKSPCQRSQRSDAYCDEARQGLRGNVEVNESCREVRAAGVNRTTSRKSEFQTTVRIEARSSIRHTLQHGWNG